MAPQETNLAGVHRSPHSLRSTNCSRLPLCSYGEDQVCGRSNGRNLSSLCPSIPEPGRASRATPLETLFPIFNRKPGVCGGCIASFCTFSTPVDDAVDNPIFSPANRRFSPPTHPAVQRAPRTEEPQFPGFPYPQGCGKTLSPSLQWQRAFGTRRPSHPRTRSRPPPSDDQPQILP